MPTAPPKLLAIFDHDGVLVDSLDAHQRAWVELGARTGLPVTASFIHETFGMANPSIFRQAPGRLHHVRPRWPGIPNSKKPAIATSPAGSITLMAGVRDLLDRLDRASGFLLAIGTSGVLANSAIDH